jgi:hypothetical protein
VSLFTIEIAAVFKPKVVGSKLIEKVELPPIVIEALGLALSVKSLALVPEIVSAPMVRTSVPVFLIVNVFFMTPVLISIEPKSVQSVIEGVVSPSAIDLAFPRMSTSGLLTVATTGVLVLETQDPLVACT